MRLLKKILKEFKKKANVSKEINYHIVSLGPNCFPKTVLTRWKLKKTKAHGELTLPFDLAWFHKAKFITEFIENNFETFFENMKYIEDINRWDNFGKINFSHESAFGPNDKKLLIEMYKKRIDNFNSIMESEKPILFVQFLKDESVEEDIENLFTTLKKERQNKPFELLVIDSINTTFPSEKVNILKVQLPDNYLDLYSKKYYKSKDGKKFEKKIINECKKIIKNKFKQKTIKYH